MSNINDTKPPANNNANSSPGKIQAKFAIPSSEEIHERVASMTSDREAKEYLRDQSLNIYRNIVANNSTPTTVEAPKIKNAFDIMLESSKVCWPASCNAVGINNLTYDNLISISNYLPKTSRALFAVALTAPSSSWREHGRSSDMQSGASKAIIAAVRMSTNTFNARGLMDVEKRLSLIDSLCHENEIEGRVNLRGDTDLTDDDAHYLNAFKHYLGRQLEQYYEGRRGDVKLKGGPWGVLDFIDIPKSLAARLTDDDLYAILVCIDARNNLKHLKLTHCLNIIGHGLEPLSGSTVLEKIDMNLCMDHTIPRVLDVAALSEEAVFHVIHDILGVEGTSLWRLQLPVKWYNNFDTGGWLDQFLVQHRAILNNNSICCYFGFDGTKKDFLRCNKFCDYELNDWVDICSRCEEHYQRLTNFFVCEDCDMICCSECEGITTCASCEISYCDDCAGWQDTNPVFLCDDMNHDPYCQDCRLSDCRDGTNDCDACKALIFDRLLIAHAAEIAAQREETDRLRQEVEELRERNA